MKLLHVVSIVVLIAVVLAEPPRRFNQRIQNRSRFFARQELAPSTSPTPTPYPPAGLKPDIPFDLPNKEAAEFPEPTITPPDQTYGPPDQTYGPPDQTYGPPEQTYEPPAPLPKQGVDTTTDEPQAERIVFLQRKPIQSSRLVKQQFRRPQFVQNLNPIPFRKSAQIKRARFQKQTLARPLVLPDGSVVYSIGF